MLDGSKSRARMLLMCEAFLKWEGPIEPPNPGTPTNPIDPGGTFTRELFWLLGLLPERLARCAESVPSAICSELSL